MECVVISEREAAAKWRALPMRTKIALLHAHAGRTQMLDRDVAPALWWYRCGCGGLCDPPAPCPMGETRGLSELGTELVEHVLATAFANQCPNPMPDSFITGHILRLEAIQDGREYWRCTQCGQPTIHPANAKEPPT